MSDVVSGVLKHAFGLLANKIRKGVAERLKDGDVTDEECRRLIVRELDDIKSKLNGLARKDLLSSLCFLQEGISGLYQSQLQFPSHDNTVESTGLATLVEGSPIKTTEPATYNSINEAVALMNAVTLLNLNSNVHFKSAIESFKLAREKATEAFCNEALSIEDRIQATQIRMMARILEKLEHPDASLSDCLQYLQQLHDVGTVREIFSVLIDGGLKSRFNRTKRLNVASSVQVMNQIVFDFAQKFTKLSLGIFEWPTILIGKEIYHPIFGEKRAALVKNLERSGFEVQLSTRCPNFTFANQITTNCSAVNRKGEIMSRIWGTNTIAIFKRSGESRTVCQVRMDEHALKSYIPAMDIDAEDNLYVVTASRGCDDPSLSFKLVIFDENGNEKLETPLSFHQIAEYPQVRMAINKNGRIAILNYEEKILYIGIVCIEMNSFQVKQSLRLKQLETDIAIDGNLQISDVNGTKVIANGLRTVYIYLENRQLPREIEIAHEHGYIISVAIDHTTKDILVQTYFSDWFYEKRSLLRFSETGHLVHSLSLDSIKREENPKLVSHSNGVVFLVGRTKAMLMKGQIK